MKTQTVDLGPCRCPGTPHERDSAEITRPEALEFAVLRRVWAARDSEVRPALGFAGETLGGLTLATFIAFATVSWTLTDERGRPIPIGLAHGAASLAAVDGLLFDAAAALVAAFDAGSYVSLLMPAAAPAAAPGIVQ
jgi:hypothetical protein